MAGPAVVLLAGGTGGARLARGLRDVVGDDLAVIANTGDDVEIHGAHVSPDPDLVTFWLADRIDARGWGLAGDTFKVMHALRELGEDVWFNLGDRDLAIGIHRSARLAAGDRLTDVTADIARALGVGARVLPMSDAPVRTRVGARDRWWTLQEFLIRGRGQGPVTEVLFEGAEAAAPTSEVLAAIAGAPAVIVGPSNPVISIGPILALPGLRRALSATGAPVIAVSPIVGGRVLKGPTAEFLAWAGQPVSAAGVAALYAGLIDGMVADEEVPGVPTLVTDGRLDTPERRRAAAAAALAFAEGLQ